MELRKFETSHNCLTLSVIGDFDASNSKTMQQCIDDLLANDNHPQIEMDLNQVEFLDTSGIGAIVYLYKRLVESNRDMCIQNAHGQPLKMMELLRIGQAIPVNKEAQYEYAH
ncbi:anti anti-sigma regulatory factor sypA [Vibrio ishigakensis]|uniref:Anti-sigma factor antagonist n=1 Tax=Vibrio ishigakensis TaxID=1481914 RepID=A0A0B8QI31_9VIBR|nr:STAS domain-containing protein [Vibrio ishigakensis]GAM59048.1 anti anti-sigma regulatory factor sypA [Vibrio ishigakensis]GAM66248.1 anti anti-sigma regulatory factor sypA [Vibrio sp. JCM 19236]GAM74254.1 anti anti-sigma regulatory factor sypA [Vibrio ishigakensis]